MNNYFKKIFVLSFSFLFSAVLLNSDINAKDIDMNIKESSLRKAIFAGGCFWCMEPPFEKLDGVIDVVSGYTDGKGENPTYEDYAQKGYVEAIEITYDPLKISYSELLDVFWRQINPTDPGGQFGDRGPYYRTAIFYNTDEEKKIAEKSKARLDKTGRFSKPIVTEISKASKFYKAEEYHQDYYKKNPVRYKLYRFGSGRDSYLKSIWGDDTEIKSPAESGGKYSKPSDDVLKKSLTKLQYEVTQHEGTEPPFDNEYWDNKREGIYVDIVSGEPLFSSIDKYKSGTGWPSFSRPLVEENIIEKKDRKLFIIRTEVRSKHGYSHLGHVFTDGPAPTGLRYCINSASLRFIPKEDLEKEGYDEFKKLFEK